MSELFMGKAPGRSVYRVVSMTFSKYITDRTKHPRQRSRMLFYLMQKYGYCSFGFSILCRAYLVDKSRHWISGELSVLFQYLSDYLKNWMWKERCSIDYCKYLWMFFKRDYYYYFLVSSRSIVFLKGMSPKKKVSRYLLGIIIVPLGLSQKLSI